jgi:hypothetical protein
LFRFYKARHRKSSNKATSLFLVSLLALTGISALTQPANAVAAASLTAISPTSGPTAGGTVITLTGSEFTSATGVTIDGVAATDFTVLSDTSITIKSPVRTGNNLTVGAKNVVVLSPNGNSVDEVRFTYKPTILLSTKGERTYKLGALASRSQGKSITRSTVSPWTVTGTDSLTSETYTYTYSKSSSSYYPFSGAYRYESYEAPNGSVSGPSVDDSNKNGVSSVSLSGGGGCGSGWNNSLNGTTVYCSVFGPDVYSEAFYGVAGQSLSFKWIAEGGGDHYEVYAYLVKVADASAIPTASTSNHILLAHGMGEKETAWTASSGNIPTDGLYRFRFVNGTYDYSGGYAVGASMFVDKNIVVGNSNTISFPDPGDQIGTSGTFTVALTSTSGAQVNVTSSSNGVCTVGNPPSYSSPTTIITVTKASEGTCVLLANQDASGIYSTAAQVTRAFDIRASATVPIAPQITSVVAGNTKLTVNFNPPSRDGGAAIDNYAYSTDGGSTFTTLSPAVTTSPIEIPGLTNGQTYQVKLRAINAIGDGTATSSTPGTPAPAAPSAPTISGVTASGSGQLSVAFTAPSDNGGSTITNYAYSTDNGLNYTVRNPVSTASPIVITGLTNGTGYQIKLKAINTSGQGTASLAATGTPVSASAPGAPTSTRARLTGADADIYIDWTAPASDGGSAITDYVIEYSDDAGANWQVATDAVSTSTNTTFTTFDRSTSYIFKVKTVNSVGSSLYGNVTSKVVRGVRPTALSLVAPTLSFTSSQSSTTTAAKSAMLTAKVVEAPAGIPGVEVIKDLSAASGSGLKILESTVIESGSKARAEIVVSSSLASNKVAAGFLRIGSGSWFYLGNKPLVLDATSGNYIASTDSMAFAAPTTPGSEFILVVAVVDPSFGEADVASLARVGTVRAARMSSNYTYNYTPVAYESSNISIAAVSNSNISNIGDAQIQLEVTVSGTALATTAPSSSGGSGYTYTPPMEAPVVEAPLITKQKSVRYYRFAPNRSALTSVATSGISKTIKSFKNPKTVLCTGYALGTSSSTFSKKVATMRAQNACQLARRLAPAIKTQVKINVSPKGGVIQRGVSLKVTGQ